MQPIVIATDFSPAADKAMFYGGALASRLTCEVVLINVYNFPVVPTSDGPVMMPYDEFHEISETGLKKSKQKLLDAYPGLLIEMKSSSGDIADQLNEEVEKLEPFLLIVGLREGRQSGMMFGSNTASIVKHCSWPVLSVPENFGVKAPKIAILATDLTPINGPVLETLRSFVQELQLELHLVHVVQSDRGESHEEVMKSLGSLQADFKTIINRDLSDGIDAYIQELNADLVITLPHAHSWLEGLFIKKHTKELVNELRIPLLCIPERSS